MSYLQAVEVVRAHLGDYRPRLGLMLGSGLGAIAERIRDPVIIPYQELPGFPKPTVQGHAGRLLIGQLEDVTVACLQGRAHSYEGHAPAAIATPIRTLRALGCDTLFLTNAAGSLRQDMPPGSLMMITDHINWAGVNPLTGPNDAALGPRFFDMSQAYEPHLQNALRAAAAAATIHLHEGVYLMYPGPNFETPAEIRAFVALGADAVGMSTVPECLVARHCGMQVTAVSSITNLAAGLAPQPLSHEETLDIAQTAAQRLARLLEYFLRRIDYA